MEIFIFARAHARAGCEAEVERAIRQVLPATRQEPGCISVRAFRAAKDPLLFYIHSHWQSEAAFALHIEQPHTQCFDETLKSLLDHEFKAERTTALA